ncbi:MAG: carbon storage regulator CsrA [Vicinamibacterales bacterium]
MLVITRRRDEAIMIGDGIEVRVLRIGRDGVRLGVTAPATVAVHRREVYEQIRQEDRPAADAKMEVSVDLRRMRQTADDAEQGLPSEPMADPCARAS